MRWSTSKLFDLARAVALGERGAQDSQITLPPSLSSVVILPNSFKSLALPPASTRVGDSSNFRGIVNTVGAGAGTTVSGQILEPGVWRLTGYFRSQFSGTPTPANTSVLELIDNASAAFLLLADAASIAHALMLAIDLVFFTPFETRLLLSTTVTVAGDFNSVTASLHCGRLI